MFNNATSFNQDLNTWDVGLISSQPSYFNTGANSTWVANLAYQPQWGV